MSNCIKVSGLSKTFTLHLVGGTRLNALHETSFALEHGTSLVIMGKTGAGKSTLLKLLAGAYRASSGAIVIQPSPESSRVELASLSDVDLIALRRRSVGYLPQHIHVVPRVPAIDVVTATGIEAGFEEAEARARAEALLDELEIKRELFPLFPSTFSPGERQRLNLACVLVRDPSLLLMDEPVSALDPRMMQQVVGMLRRHRSRPGGATLVTILHQVAAAEQLADCVMVIEDARMKALGTVSEVLQAT